MGIFEQFPYTNFHDLNLDWILHAIQSMDKKLDEFVASNVLSYADPIQWDIETQYAKNTVVIDPKTGTAYMSINPVPAGQLLTNKYYWQPIFNYDEIVNTLKKQIAAVQADQNNIIPVAANQNTLVWVVNKLYRLTKSLAAGSKITENENAIPITLEEWINLYISCIKSAITLNDQKYNVIATEPFKMGALLWWRDNLYKAKKDIVLNEYLSNDVNLEPVNIEEIIKNIETRLNDDEKYPIYYPEEERIKFKGSIEGSPIIKTTADAHIYDQAKETMEIIPVESEV